VSLTVVAVSLKRECVRNESRDDPVEVVVEKRLGEVAADEASPDRDENTYTRVQQANTKLAQFRCVNSLSRVLPNLVIIHTRVFKLQPHNRNLILDRDNIGQDELSASMDNTE
jgi:hypothetical protein